jgi:hypothetical protein
VPGDLLEHVRQGPVAVGEVEPAGDLQAPGTWSRGGRIRRYRVVAGVEVQKPFCAEYGGVVMDVREESGRVTVPVGLRAAVSGLFEPQ